MVVARTPILSASTPESGGEAIAHLHPVWGDSRLLADQHTIGIDEREACLAHLTVRLCEQYEGVGAAVRLVLRGKEGADVGEPCGAEERIGERVCDHIAIGMARRARAGDRS